MPVLFCSGNLYASGIAGDAEAALQNKIHSIHRNFCISAWKFLVRSDLLTILCDSAAGIWYDFCDPFHLFPDPVFSDTETENWRIKRRGLRCSALRWRFL